MAVSDELRQHLMDVAEENGVDPEELIAQVESQMTEEPGAEERTPGKNDAAAPASAGGESAAKAHGGRGYFAYEYPFLKTNEVRASLFLEPVSDGDMFTGEWLAKHGGGGQGGATE